jgi:hypothetical protein
VFETVDSCLSVSQFMHEESFEADTLDLVHRILFKISQPNKLSHNCLSQDPLTCRLFFVFRVWSMVESPGQKKLRLTKERLTSELRQRTENKLALLKVQSFDRSTDIETKATQCNDRTPCLYASLFCFWLVVANLLLAQWLYTTGRLKLN